MYNQLRLEPYTLDGGANWRNISVNNRCAQVVQKETRQYYWLSPLLSKEFMCKLCRTENFTFLKKKNFHSSVLFDMSFLTLKFDCQTVLLSFLFSSCLLLLLLRTHLHLPKGHQGRFSQTFCSFIPNFFVSLYYIFFCFMSCHHKFFIAMRCR